MTILKPTLSQAMTLLTIFAMLAGWGWHFQANHDASLITQHDQEQRIDSIANAFSIFVTKFDDLRKNREVTLKANADKDERFDQRIDALELQVEVLQTRFDDYLFYKNKK